ncbi:TRAP transporter solute receptor, DctP family protein [Catenovulum agarivorans DS-2]|uniref:TRAP transporter solute receptor, DctP family protein n=1 Tax=Catenovulum agarivorans DS-2 TaxID=1328313 RepID=W7Q8T3_9ALTE|nr:TRAP transporter substrate-binding protein [Catenovulum agarivorans]EWH08421.1 TRAP transporter solute receptor, DctP family protein [Catenovulum agarivorans DS-2]
MNWFKTVFCLSFLVVLTSCGGEQQKVVLRMGHTLDTEHSVHKAMVHMAERLQHYSNGEMDVVIYPSAQLGNEREMVELLQIGSLAMTKVSAATIEGFVPEMKVFSLPYIFQSREHRWRVLNGDVGQNLLNETQKAHLVGLGYYDAGSRSFYMTDTRVKEPKDLTGKKIRVMESQTAVKMVQAFSGAATPISFGELYAALQQGVVDGAENNPPSFYLSRHYEISKYYILNEHTSVPDVIVGSAHVYNNLTEQQQLWLKKAIQDSVEYQKQLWLEGELQALAEVKKAGVEVIYPDKTPFINAVQDFHATFKGTRIGQYLEQIASMNEGK